MATAQYNPPLRRPDESLTDHNQRLREYRDAWNEARRQAENHNLATYGEDFQFGEDTSGLTLRHLYECALLQGAIAHQGLPALAESDETGRLIARVDCLAEALIGRDLARRRQLRDMRDARFAAVNLRFANEDPDNA